MNYRLFILALGTFAIGTEGFMIAGVLPMLAQDLHVSLPAAGQLVTAFSLAYAFGSPLLAMVTGRVERRALFLGALLLFALANVLCGMANHYGLLLSGRVMAAFGAALFVPAASAAAADLVAPEHRGKALAVVIGGQTVALASGVPIGTWVAHAFHWRTTFWMVGILALIAAILVRWRFPVMDAAASARLRDRLAQLRRPVIWTSLLATVCWGTGAFTVYTYIADVFGQLGATPRMISLVLLIWGVSSLIGSTLGGFAVDRFGSARTIPLTLTALFAALTLLSVLTSGPPTHQALAIGIAAMAVWGVSAWAFNPAQQHRLIALSGKAAGLVVSLNPSAIYLGSALGAAVGGLAVSYGHAAGLGYIGGVCELLAIGAFAASRIRERRTAAGD
ncbi:MFS transporter, arabinose efflux permease [Thermobacillus xylanilyticus]|uniref:MFS transporter, arabinose efflux permease n=1 Tax=Thermobacillus xylanilyticus TaxID=76633 RepID=A0ABN7RQR9_THEXY|nr:MFS transporter [Thermobacillus xylanilyticus]REJ17962.1 MAG: MFS transporter [Paenibacillaceae bacterium]CAG5080628.1 MFS transporter, arabinose efflux permease [Thermobacillus xylanilyticus]